MTVVEHLHAARAAARTGNAALGAVEAAALRIDSPGAMLRDADRVHAVFGTWLDAGRELWSHVEAAGEAAARPAEFVDWWSKLSDGAGSRFLLGSHAHEIELATVRDRVGRELSLWTWSAGPFRGRPLAASARRHQSWLHSNVYLHGARILWPWPAAST